MGVGKAFGPWRKGNAVSDIQTFFARFYTLDDSARRATLMSGERKELVRAAFYHDMVRAGYRPLGAATIKDMGVLFSARCEVQASDVYHGMTLGA